MQKFFIAGGCRRYRDRYSCFLIYSRHRAQLAVKFLDIILNDAQTIYQDVIQSQRLTYCHRVYERSRQLLDQGPKFHFVDACFCSTEDMGPSPQVVQGCSSETLLQSKFHKVHSLRLLKIEQPPRNEVRLCVLTIGV
jgi:hypothetical protein